MKKLLLPLLILLAFQASAQLPGATTINSRYDWLGGRFRALKLPMYADTTQYPNWLPRVGGDVMLDTAGSDKGTIYVKYERYWHGIIGGGGGGSDSTETYLAAGLGIIISQVGDTLVIGATGGTDPLSFKANNIRTEASLDSLIAATGSRSNIWIVDTLVPVTANKTIPSNVTIQHEPGGGFNVANTRVLTVNGPLLAGRFQVFYGLGNAILGVGSVSSVFPEWYGSKAALATGSDGVDDQAGMVKAFAGGVNIKFMQMGSGKYELAGELAIPQGWRVSGNQWQITVLQAIEAMTNVVTLGSRVTLERTRVNGAFLADIGVHVLDGNRADVLNNEIINCNLYAMQTDVINNSTIANNTMQYAGVAQLHINGSLNTLFLGNNGNSDDNIIGDSTTVGVLVTDSRNCHFIGGIWERSSNKYQFKILKSDDLHLSDMEINNGEVGLYVAAGTVTVDHVEFTNPKYRAMYAAGGGSINVIDNGTAMVGGSNGRPKSFLRGGNTIVNGSASYPLWSYNMRGGSAGSALSSATIAYDSLKQNFTVTTTSSLTSGWSIGLGTTTYNVPVGTGINFRTHIKNISPSQNLIAYMELAAGGRRLMGYLSPGYNSIHYTARGDERFRVDVSAGSAVVTSFNPALAELWVTAGDSTANNDTLRKYETIEYATTITDNNRLRVFSTALTQSLLTSTTKGVPFNEGSIFLGNSITVGYAPEGMVTPWPSLVGSALGITPNNLGTSSTGSRWAVYRAHMNSGLNLSNALGAMIGFNDMRPSSASDSAIRIGTILSGSRALAAYQFTKSIQFYRSGNAGAVNPNVTSSQAARPPVDIDSLNDMGSRAGWFRTNDPSNTTANIWFKTSTTANETVTIAGVKGSALAVGTWATDGTTNNWSRIEVSVDGVVKATYTPNGKTYATNGTGYFTIVGIQNDAIIITGLRDTLHTVVLKFLDGSRRAGWDYVAGLKSGVESTIAPMYMLDLPHMNALGYTNSFTTEAMLDSATSSRRRELAGLLPDYPIFNVQTNKYFNPNDVTQESSDGIHPISLGQQNIAKAVLENINGAYQGKLNLTNVTGGVVAPDRLLVGDNTNRYMGLEKTRVFWNDIATSTSNNKNWDMYAGSNRLVLRMLNDANNAETEIMRVNRTGMTLDHISFPNGNVRIGGLTGVSKLHVTGTVRFDALSSVQTDTTVFKPVGINTSGDVVPMGYWPRAASSTAGAPAHDSASITEINAGTVNNKFAAPLQLAGSKYTDQYDAKNYIVLTGGSAAYVATVVPAITSYTAGLRLNVMMPNNASTSATINVNGLGAKNIVQGVSTTVQSTTLVSGGVYTLIYNGTNFLVTSWYTDATKANLVSPTFTGTPTLPTGTIATTQTAGNSTTAVATTAFVAALGALKANLAGANTFTGTQTLSTLSGTNIGNVIVGSTGALSRRDGHYWSNTTSAAATLTLVTDDYYVFTGTTTTWTLPAASASGNRGYIIKNRGSGNITLNSASGTEIYTTTGVASITIAPGSSVTIISDGAFWGVN